MLPSDTAKEVTLSLPTVGTVFLTFHSYSPFILLFLWIPYSGKTKQTLFFLLLLLLQQMAPLVIQLFKPKTWESLFLSFPDLQSTGTSG